MVARHFSRAGAAFVIAGVTAMGCSHAWDVLEPLPGSTGTGGSATASSSGGTGGASATSTSTSTSTSTTSGMGGAGGATSSSAQSSSADASSSAQSSSADASSSAQSSSAAASSSSGAGGGGSTAYYAATFAACNSDQDLDIAKCEALYGNGTMDIDAQTTAGLVAHAYVRFDLDAQLAGKTIDAVTLRLTTLSDPNAQANSDKSGDIFAVGPFDATSLGMAQPATIGGPVGLDLGPVAIGTDYYWGLQNLPVVASSSVYLAVITTSGDGVRYWNDHGTVPPLLIVNYH
jgi:hypothetical protein